MPRGKNRAGIGQLIRRLTALAALVALLGLALAEAGPAEAAPAEKPDLDARAWALVDARDGTRLAAHAAGRDLPVASATKLMTAYLALRELRFDRTLRAPAYAALPAESVLGLVAGERIRVRDLLVAMLLPSANDAAVAVANGVSGSVPRFVAEMNRAAARLGLEDTSFANPIGLDDPLNHSSARDLIALTLELRKDERFRRIVAMPDATLRSGARTRQVTTRNSLLRADPSVDGVKTGHTLGAGYVLVASAERKGVPLVSAVLGAASESARDAESEQLLDYGYSLYRRERPVRDEQQLASAEVTYEDRELGLLAARGVALQARRDQELSVAVEAPERVEGPIARGERLGIATVTLDGERVERVPLRAADAVAEPGLLAPLGGTGSAIGIVAGAIVILIGVVVTRRRVRGGETRTPEERMESREERIRRRGTA